MQNLLAQETYHTCNNPGLALPKVRFFYAPTPPAGHHDRAISEWDKARGCQQTLPEIAVFNRYNEPQTGFDKIWIGLEALRSRTYCASRS